MPIDETPRGGDDARARAPREPHDEPDTLLANLVALSQDAVIVRDARDRVIYWNPGAEALYGWSVTEALGRITHELLGTEFPQGRGDALARLTHEDRWEGELQHHTRDGRTITTWSRWAAHREDGQIVGVLEVNRDVSDERRLRQTLEEQTAELTITSEHLQEQASELEASNEQLQQQAAELEMSNQQLGDQAAELEIANAQLAQQSEDLAESERRYRMMFERNPLPMWVYDDETLAFLAVNEAAVATYGWSREEFARMTLRDIREPGDIAHLERLRGRVQAGRTYVQEIVRHRTRDGRRCQVQIVSHGLDWEGRPARLVLAEDVTERLAAESAMRRSEARLGGIVRSAMDAIVSVDSSQRIVVFNQAAERIFGVTPAEAIGARIDRFLPERHRATHARHVAEFERGGDTVRSMTSLGELTALRADGTEFPIEATISRTESGGEILLTVILRDVSKRRLLEEQLRQAQKMEAVGRLAGGIAHDFNNLLTVIHGYLDMAREELPEDSAVREDLAQVADAARRASNLTRQLLAFSRRQVLQPRVLSLESVLHGLQSLLGRLIGEDVRLVLDLASDVSPVRADPTHLEQVVMNLAVNARDAMPKGGTLTLRVLRLDPHDAAATGHFPPVPRREWTVLEVRDTGVGMNDATLARLFEPFFTTKPPGKGTGLGLATVFGIVEQSGGRVWVESAVDLGTSVYVAFPSVVDGSASVVMDTSGDLRLPSSGTRVLLVEDDDLVRRLTHRLLQSLELDVVEASNGHEALKQWRETEARGQAFDVVVTDVVMPELGGVELVRRLRMERPSLPVVFVSGYTGQELPDVNHEARAAFVSKPFTVAQLSAALADVTTSTT